MKRLLTLAVLAAACGPAPQSPSQAQNPPGQESQLEKVARAALACPTGTLTWSTDGGTISATGDFTAPPCTAPYADATYHVTVSGCGNTTILPITVSDTLRSIAVYCGVVAPETCCRIPPWTVPPGTQVQVYAALQYSCAGHVEYSQAPPALCP